MVASYGAVPTAPASIAQYYAGADTRLLTVISYENCSTTDLFLFRSDPILRWENLTILNVSKNIAWFWGPDDELLL